MPHRADLQAAMAAPRLPPTAGFRPGHSHLDRKIETQSPEGDREVLCLASPFRGAADQAGRLMRQAHGCLDLVAVLAAGARSALKPDAAFGSQLGVRAVGRMTQGDRRMVRCSFCVAAPLRECFPSGKSDRFRVLSVGLYYSAGCVVVCETLVDSSVRTHG